MRALLTLGVSLGVLAFACGSPTTCSAGNCPGCCDSSGTCQPGNSTVTCGAGGNRCDACRLSETCAAGVCLPGSGGSSGGVGGGAGGGTGGSAGGSAGGAGGGAAGGAAGGNAGGAGGGGTGGGSAGGSAGGAAGGTAGGAGGGGIVSYGLSVTLSGNGAGRVTSSPSGIDCGFACSAAFDNGTVVTLSQAPNAGSVFTSWSGACGGTGTCAVTMDQARNVTAIFTLTDAGSGGGGGTGGGSGGGAGGGAGGGGPQDAGQQCAKDDDCAQRGDGSRCDLHRQQCVAARGCSATSDCTSQDASDYCYQYGTQCRCVVEANPTGLPGVCRRRLAACEECTTDEQCGSSIVFDPIGTCKTLQGDVSGKKYCFRQKVGQCPCGMIDDGAGYCRPQSNSCTQVGCSADWDCAPGSVCNAAACLCVPRCRWDFQAMELLPPGCPPGQTCWVDNANLDSRAIAFGAGRCRAPCQGDSDCAYDAGTNPYGGSKLVCRGEVLDGGGLSAMRCRANGTCMDDLECPAQPITSISLGYCDRGSLTCSADCRPGTDPITGTSYSDCRAPYACVADGGVNLCRLLTCVEQGGASIACARGQYCCGEDKDGVGGPDPCPPSSALGPSGCYDAPRPPFCTSCQSVGDCDSVQLPAYLTGAGACSTGSKSPSCSVLPMQCISAGARPDGGQGLNVCAPSTWNDQTRDSFGISKATRGCPAGYATSHFYPRVAQLQDDYCSTDSDCNLGTDAGRCAADVAQRLPDGGHPKACLCTAGSTNQCPNSSDGGVRSQCKHGATGQTVACITSVNCTPPPGNVYAAPASPTNGCGL